MAYNPFLYSWLGILALCIFGVSFLFVIFEHQFGIQKSKPMLVGAGLLWMLVGLGGKLSYLPAQSVLLVNKTFVEIFGLFFFLLASMVFITMMEEFGMFHYVQGVLARLGASYRRLYWAVGIFAFLISSFINNMASAMVAGAVVLGTIGGTSGLENISRKDKKFLVLTFISIVVATNAGGVYSPFGDVTTLMVWQQKILQLTQFFPLFFPGLINFLVPVLAMSFFIPSGKIVQRETLENTPQAGKWAILFWFLFSIGLSIVVRQVFDIPAVIGMVMGMGIMQLYVWYVLKFRHKSKIFRVAADSGQAPSRGMYGGMWDIYKRLQRAEWDSLLFFYGILLAVGALAAMGYVEFVVKGLYGLMPASIANIFIGIISSVVDNVPTMYAVISGHPHMPLDQWQLVTFTDSVGGSLLAVGSASGVALMGQAPGLYNFASHLRWSGVILLGYLSACGAHLAIQTFL